MLFRPLKFIDRSSVVYTESSLIVVSWGWGESVINCKYSKMMIKISTENLRMSYRHVLNTYRRKNVGSFPYDG